MNRLARIRARRAQGIRIRRPPLPAQQPPDRIEATYRRELLGMVRLAQQLVMQRLGPVLQRLEREQEAARQDEALPDAAALILEARLEFERTITVQRAERTAARVGEQLDLFNRRQVARQLRAVLPIDVEAAFGVTTQEIAAFAREGVDLIQSMSAKYFDEVQEVISDGFARGRRASSIAKDINRRGEVSESRARFIARDQVAKLNGRLTQKRQEDLGIERYVWRSSRDSRVRERHRDLDGQTFRWDDPPVVDEATGRRAHPGEDFQCRCRAEPDLDALLDELEASEDLPPVPAQAEAVLPEAARPLVDLEKILPAVPLPRLPGQRAPTWAGMARASPRPPSGRALLARQSPAPSAAPSSESFGVQGTGAAAVARAHPQMAEALGDVLRVDSIELPQVARNVSDLALINPQVLDRLRRGGLTQAHLGVGGVPELGPMEYLRGVRLPDGRLWDEVAGAYDPKTRALVAGTMPHGSRSLALHEGGHAVGHLLRADSSSDWLMLHRGAVERGMIQGEYFLDARENFAETFAMFVGARSRGEVIGLLENEDPGNTLWARQIVDFMESLLGFGPRGRLTQDGVGLRVDQGGDMEPMVSVILQADGRIRYRFAAYGPGGIMGDGLAYAEPGTAKWDELRPSAITEAELEERKAAMAKRIKELEEEEKAGLL